MRRAPLLAALLVVCDWLLRVPLVQAGFCGGWVQCRCGDTLTTDYVMTQDLGPCPGHGLVVKSHVTLDCRGFKFVGLGDGSEQYGIYLDGDPGVEVTGATVRDCDVSRFLRGIRLRAADGNVVKDSFSHGNGDFSGHVGYGIDLAVGSANNLLQGNMIQGNADEGIHFGSDTGPNQFIGNVVFDNYREQIYVLASDGNTFIGNTSYGTGSNSLYLKDSKDNYLEGNTFRDHTARLTGDASGNVFVDNVFVNATLQFRVYDATPDRIPTDNVVLRGSITNTGTCVRFTSTTGNMISDVALNTCATEVLSEGTATEFSANTVVSTALNAAKVSADADSTLSVGWWLRIHVQDANGLPILGARVQALDADGEVAFDLVSDANGALPGQVIIQYARSGSSTIAKTPYTLTTTIDGQLADSRVVQATQDLDVIVVLSAGDTSGGSGEFSDNFNRADSPALENGWLEVQGHLVVSGGELRNAADKGSHLAVVPALSGATHSAAADFASVDNNQAPRFGVVLRFQDPQNYYLVYRKAGGGSVLRIAKIVNGKEAILASTSIKNPGLNRFFRLGGQAAGTTLTLELDGSPRLVVSDSTFSGGSVGILLGSNSTKAYRVDNVSAVVQ